VSGRCGSCLAAAGGRPKTRASRGSEHPAGRVSPLTQHAGTIFPNRPKTKQKEAKTQAPGKTKLTIKVLGGKSKGASADADDRGRAPPTEQRGPPTVRVPPPTAAALPIAGTWMPYQCFSTSCFSNQPVTYGTGATVFGGHSRRRGRVRVFPLTPARTGACLHRSSSPSTAQERPVAQNQTDQPQRRHQFAQEGRGSGWSGE
jgi:hypothetical protein